MTKEMKQYLETVVTSIVNEDAAAAKEAFHEYLRLKTQEVLGEKADKDEDEGSGEDKDEGSGEDKDEGSGEDKDEEEDKRPAFLKKKGEEDEEGKGKKGKMQKSC